MAQFEQLAGLLSGLKGAPASVLWALSLADRPLSNGELLALTGYSRKPVRRAVRALLAQGIIQRDGPRVVTLAPGWPYPMVERAAGPGQRTASPARRTTHPAAPNRRPAGTVSPSETESPRNVAGTAGQKAWESVDTTGQGENDLESGRAGAENGHFGRHDPVAVVVDPDPDPYDQQQQQEIPDGAQQLAAVLRRAGINGRAFWKLVGRADLAAQPEQVTAWWWYYLAQEGVRNPAGATISRLYGRDRPPEGYLTLAQLWPAMDEALREELESLVVRNWSAEQIAARLRPDCPGLSVGAVLAYMTLSPAELER